MIIVCPALTGAHRTVAVDLVWDITITLPHLTSHFDWPQEDAASVFSMALIRAERPFRGGL